MKPDAGKSKAEAGLLQTVRDRCAGRAVRVFVPQGKCGQRRHGALGSRAGAHGVRPYAAKIRIAPRRLGEALQEWEQGRKNPSGAARTLLKIAGTNPKALLAVADD